MYCVCMYDILRVVCVFFISPFLPPPLASQPSVGGSPPFKKREVFSLLLLLLGLRSWVSAMCLERILILTDAIQIQMISIQLNSI